MTKETRTQFIQVCEDADSLEPYNKLKLAVYLNYAVFLYDACGKVSDARQVAKKAFDDSL